MIAMVVFLSLTSGPVNIDIDHIDKVEHTLAYLILMGWFAQIYDSTKTRLLFAVGFIGMGIGLEFLQGMGGVRYFEYSDMVANSLGVVLGWVLTRKRFDRILVTLERQVFRG